MVKKKGMDVIKNLLFALNEIKKTSKIIFPLILVIAVISAAISVIDLFLLKWIIDYALTEPFALSELILYLFLYFFVIMIFQAIYSLFDKFFIAGFETKIMARTKGELYQKIETIDLIDYCDSEFYDKLNRALNQIGIQYFKILIQLLCLLIRFFTFIVVFTYYGDLVIFLASIINVVNYVIYYFLANKTKYNFDKKEETYYRYHEYLDRVFYLQEYAQELRLVDGIKEKIISKDENNTYEYIKRFRPFLRKFAGKSILMTAISNFIFALTSIYVSGQLLDKMITLGEFLVAISVVSSMSTQIIEIVKIIPDIYHSGLWVSDIREVLDYSSSCSDKEEGITANRFEELSANNVCFRYDENSAFSIRNFSFSLKKNQVIAISGLNGSGKSTLMDLILNLLQPQSGQFYLNGIPYEDYNLRSLRNMFSVVFQDFQMYEVSIAENILMHEIESDADKHIVEEALKFSGLYEKVMSLEKGIDTVMSTEENAFVFSGGERQKLAIARAYAKPAPILLFDEPTSALDVFAAEAFYSDLFRMKEQQDRTIIYTTHKLKYTANADKIIYIKDGMIHEAGTQQELICRNKEYASLYHLSNS